jgi:hypothetical protein
MPLLFAGGVCCAVPAFVDGAAAVAGADVAVGLLAGGADGALLDADAGPDLFAGEALAAGAVLPSPVLLTAALSVVSEVALFFDRDFFALAVSAPVALFPDESAVAVLLAAELSAASALLLFLEVLFLGVAVALSDAAASVLAAVFFLDLEVVLFAESTVASALL